MSPTAARRGRRSAAGSRRPQASTEPDLRDPSLYFDRELSWLSFNDRVLGTGARWPPAARAREVLRHRRQQSRRVFHGAARPARFARASPRHGNARRAFASSGKTRCAKNSRAERIIIVDAAGLSQTTTANSCAPLQRRRLPGADAAGIRPGSSVSARLEPQQESRCRRRAQGTDEIRARESARPAPALRLASRSPEDADTERFAMLEDVIRDNLNQLFPGVAHPHRASVPRRPRHGMSLWPTRRTRRRRSSKWSIAVCGSSATGRCRCSKSTTRCRGACSICSSTISRRAATSSSGREAGWDSPTGWRCSRSRGPS